MIVNCVDSRVMEIREKFSDLPSFWCHKEISLPENTRRNIAFLGEIDFLDIEAGRISGCLFAERFNLAGAVVGGISRKIDDPSFFLQFYVAYLIGSEWRYASLGQKEGIAFSDDYERDDVVFVSDVSRKSLMKIGELPQWKWSEAVWPTLAGSMMTFVSNYDLDGEKYGDFLAKNMRIFLFYAFMNGVCSFKIVVQNIKFQTVRGHYASEARKYKKKD